MVRDVDGTPCWFPLPHAQYHRYRQQQQQRQNVHDKRTMSISPRYHHHHHRCLDHFQTTPRVFDERPNPNSIQRNAMQCTIEHALKQNNPTNTQWKQNDDVKK